MATQARHNIEDDHPLALFWGLGSLYLSSTMRGIANNQDFQKSIGGKLRALRREAGLSQRGLALKLDLSHQQIQKYERGDNALPLHRVKSFAAALGVLPAILAFPEIDRKSVDSSLGLSPDRAELLRLYDAMPDRDSRIHLMELIRNLQKLVKRLA